MRKLLLVLWTSAMVLDSQSAKILVVNPMPAYSHFSIPFGIAKELASRGHEITCINSYPQRKKMENYTDVQVVDNIRLIEDLKKRLFDRNKIGFFGELTSVFDLMANIVNNTIHHKNVQKLLQSDKTFDAVIIESFFNEAFVGFGYHYKAPVILVSSHSASAMNNYIFANPNPTSYVSGFGKQYSKHMDFWQRLQNLATTTVFSTLLEFYHLPQQRNIFKSFIAEHVELDDVLYNTSLMLTNSHPSFSSPIPIVPNIIEIGGFHVTLKELPDDLQEYLDGANNGVIVFSMGSNLRSDDLKPETRQGILKAFSKIKQKVLWKFETDLPNAPENVNISFWLPQQDVLAHPNVRALITHGGRLSTVEAVYFGVPVIGIPVFGDQIHNVGSAVADGYAVKINLEELSEETLSWALDEILTNPKYKKNAEYRSKLLHDRPLKPIETAVFWVEHVIRHQGAPHLRSAGLDLKWYQREMIDIAIFLVLVFCTIVGITYEMLKKLWVILTRQKRISTKNIKAKKSKKTQ